MRIRKVPTYAGLETLEPRVLLSSAPVVNLSVEVATADEAAMTSGVIRVDLDHAPGVETKVKLRVSGTARRGRDYAISQTVVVFGPDDVTSSVLITPIDDGKGLGDRTATVRVVRRRGYQVGEASRATVTVIDKEPKVTITAPDSQAAETISTQDPDTGCYRIVQSGDQPLDVCFAMRGSAKSVSDYVLYAGSTAVADRIVTVPPGPDGVDVTLVPIDDTAVRSKPLSAVLKLLKNACYSLPRAVADRSEKVLIADNDVSTKFTITSPDFRNGAKFSNGDFLLKSPQFNWVNAPEGTQSFAFIVETPCPVYRPFVQWVVYNIPADTTHLASNDLPAGARQGPNSTGLSMWLGPVAPPGTKHFYYFRLYALDVDLHLTSGLNRAQVLSAMSGHVISSTVMTATCGSGIPVYNDITDYFKNWF